MNASEHVRGLVRGMFPKKGKPKSDRVRLNALADALLEIGAERVGTALAGPVEPYLRGVGLSLSGDAYEWVTFPNPADRGMGIVMREVRMATATPGRGYHYARLGWWVSVTGPWYNSGLAPYHNRNRKLEFLIREKMNETGRNPQEGK